MADEPPPPSSSDTPPPPASSNSDTTPPSLEGPPPAASHIVVPPVRSKSFLRRSRSTPRLPSESFDSMTMNADSPQQIAASIKGKAVATTSYSSSKPLSASIKGKAIATTSSSSSSSFSSNPAASVYIRGRSSSLYYVQRQYQRPSHWPSDLFPRYAAQPSEIGEAIPSDADPSDEWSDIMLRDPNWTQRAPSTPSRFPQPVQDLCKAFSLSIGVLFIGYMAYYTARYPFMYKDR
ncbi:hypothetical protein P8452_42966 [Trifolium repens]|nr:hypothetical protein P8452_42966 [Trifolium repens]